MRFRFGTDIGLKREENQDAVRCEYFGHNVLAVVCDGMGGERAGKEASALAIEEFFQRFSADYKESLSDEDIRKLLISSISAANSVIYTRARFDFKNFGMGRDKNAALDLRQIPHRGQRPLIQHRIPHQDDMVLIEGFL